MKAKLIKPFVTVALLGLAIWAAVSLYHRYLQNPWTRDGQVRADDRAGNPRGDADDIGADLAISRPGIL